MWIFYLVAILTISAVIWGLYKYMYKTSQPPIDSFYYLAVDNTGNKSIIHDSGIRPSKTQPGSVITLQILKREYNDGKPNDLTFPSAIKLGMNPKELEWSYQPQNIQDHGEYYAVDIMSPENPFYGTVDKSPIDLRKEVFE